MPAPTVPPAPPRLSMITWRPSVRGQHRGERPGEGVGAAAGGEGHDEGDRPGRPAAALGPGAADEGQGEGGAGRGEELASAGAGAVVGKGMRSLRRSGRVGRFLPRPAARRQSVPISAAVAARMRLPASRYPASARRSSMPASAVERQARAPVRAHQGEPQGARQGPRTPPRRSPPAPSTRSGRAPARARRPARASLERHLVGPPRRPALAPAAKAAGPRDQLYAEAAKKQRQGPLDDDQGTARAHGRPVRPQCARPARPAAVQGRASGR